MIKGITDNFYNFFVYVRDRIQVIDGSLTDSISVGTVYASSVNDAIELANDLEEELDLDVTDEIILLSVNYYNDLFAVTDNELEMAYEYDNLNGELYYLLSDHYDGNDPYNRGMRRGSHFCIVTIFNLIQIIRMYFHDCETSDVLCEYLQLIGWYVTAIFLLDSQADSVKTLVKDKEFAQMFPAVTHDPDTITTDDGLFSVMDSVFFHRYVLTGLTDMDRYHRYHQLKEDYAMFEERIFADD